MDTGNTGVINVDKYSLGNISFYIISTLLLALFINTFIQLVQILYTRRKQNVALKRFLGPKPHWLYGNFRSSSFGKGFLKSLENSRNYGPAYITHAGPLSRTVHLATPEFIQSVMNTSEPKGYTYRFIKYWIGDGLLISKGKKWARNRRLLTPAFHFDILKPYQAAFSSCANIMADKWVRMLTKDPDTSIEMFEHVSLMTLDSLMKCIFGVQSNFQTETVRNPYIKSVYELTELILKRIRNPVHYSGVLYYFSSDGYKFRKVLQSARTFTSNVIKKKRNDLKHSKEEPRSVRYLDFLDILLSCRDSDGNGLSDDEIQDTFMFEGHDTTASGISWCLYNLACNKDIQEKCRQEINIVLGERSEVGWDDLSRLNYLTMCIKESLRTHPPVSGITRLTTRDHRLPDDRTIPEGVSVQFDIYACHHNPKVWPNPEVYDPDRFLPDEVSKRHPHAFIPFSTGPRNCIGQHFAMNELKTVMALLIKKFELSVDTTKRPDEHFTLIFRSKDGVWLKVKEI